MAELELIKKTKDFFFVFIFYPPPQNIAGVSPRMNARRKNDIMLSQRMEQLWGISY